MSSQFIQKVLLPYFQGFTNSSIDVALYDVDGKLLYTTPRVATGMNVPLEKLLGISYKNVTREIICQACEVYNKADVDNIVKVTQQIARIHDIAVTDKILINYIDFIPYKNYYEAYLVNYFPLFDNDGKVVAAQSISSKFYLFGILDYINELADKRHSRILTNKSQDSTLSVRQHEVMFLLLCGMSQNDIAVFLNLSRGSISRLVGRLCEKFDIDGINVQLLLRQARKLHIHESIPKSLNKPRIIILDPYIKRTYF